MRREAFSCIALLLHFGGVLFAARPKQRSSTVLHGTEEVRSVVQEEWGDTGVNHDGGGTLGHREASRTNGSHQGDPFVLRNTPETLGHIATVSSVLQVSGEARAKQTTARGRQDQHLWEGVGKQQEQQGRQDAQHFHELQHLHNSEQQQQQKQSTAEGRSQRRSHSKQHLDQAHGQQSQHLQNNQHHQHQGHHMKQENRQHSKQSRGTGEQTNATQNHIANANLPHKSSNESHVVSGTSSSSQPIIFSGASGINAAAINGRYMSVGKLYNGKTLYQKEKDPDRWLRYVTANGLNQWRISSTAGLDANNDKGYAYSMESGLDTPVLASSWYVWDGGQWVLEESIEATVEQDHEHDRGSGQGHAEVDDFIESSKNNCLRLFYVLMGCMGICGICGLIFILYRRRLTGHPILPSWAHTFDLSGRIKRWSFAVYNLPKMKESMFTKQTQQCTTCSPTIVLSPSG